MAYVALYRAYRPQKFSEVSGQTHIVRTIKNAIINNKLAHAYLFSGPRGTGKTSIAKIIAKAINCPNQVDGEPCNECDICKGITNGTITDVVEMDAASYNGVDEIRLIRDNVKYLPSVCKYKVYIIDEVHMLSTSAFNALLKTLEEPPAHVIFILATTEVHKILPTIISRTQRFDFRGVSLNEIKERLNYVCKEENINITKEALTLIAAKAEGGMRDALSLLDEAISYSEQLVDEKAVYEVSGSVDLDNLLELTKNILNKDSSAALDSLNKIIDLGKEMPKICSDLISFYRDVLLFKNSSQTERALFSNEQFIAFAKKVSNERIYYYLNVLNEAQNNMRFTNQKQTYLELAVIKMSDYNMQVEIDNTEDLIDLKNKVAKLEQQIKIMPSKISTEELVNVTIKKDDSKKYITVDLIDDILNNINKDLRKKLENNLLGYKKSNTMLDKYLKQVKVGPCGNKKAVLIFNNNITCDFMMKYPNKEKALEILNGNEYNLDDYYALPEDIWNQINKDFMNQYKSGKQIKLNDLDIDVVIYQPEIKNDEDILKGIFGDNLNII